MGGKFSGIPEGFICCVTTPGSLSSALAIPDLELRQRGTALQARRRLGIHSEEGAFSKRGSGSLMPPGRPSFQRTGEAYAMLMDGIASIDMCDGGARSVA